MSFYDIYNQYKDFDFETFLNRVQDKDILRILQQDKISREDYLMLLSPTAEKYMEAMAQKAHKISLQHFGRTIVLYTPMYLANYCVNKCAYCSYNIENKLKRKKLTMDEIDKEARAIAQTGLKHILILTGESKKESPVSYIIEAVQVLKKYFDSISIEIYPLKDEEYREVIEPGVDGLTIYQEAYNEEVYDRIHLAGPKKRYQNRLDAPERGCRAGMRTVSIGALLGLHGWRSESFFTGIHAEYLQNKYPEVEMGVSLPRIRPHVGAFDDIQAVDDKNLVQIMLATRIFMPSIGINISTRERREFRDNLIPLGVTHMSAGVSTEVGGHTLEENKGDGQFEVSDTRTVKEILEAIMGKGYHPVFKNWVRF